MLPILRGPLNCVTRFRFSGGCNAAPMDISPYSVACIPVEHLALGFPGCRVVKMPGNLSQSNGFFGGLNFLEGCLCRLLCNRRRQRFVVQIAWVSLAAGSKNIQSENFGRLRKSMSSPLSSTSMGLAYPHLHSAKPSGEPPFWVTQVGLETQDTPY